jgi:hypothetical protein
MTSENIFILSALLLFSCLLCCDFFCGWFVIGCWSNLVILFFLYIYIFIHITIWNIRGTNPCLTLWCRTPGYLGSRCWLRWCTTSLLGVTGILTWKFFTPCKHCGVLKRESSKRSRRKNNVGNHEFNLYSAKKLKTNWFWHLQSVSTTRRAY